MSSFRDLEIYKLSYDLALQVHKLTMELPKFELYEQGSQLRRSSKRIKDTIAEGYGRKRYKNEFIRFLIYAHSSCDEAISQIGMISDIYFQEKPLTKLLEEYDKLGGMINKFIQYVEKNWK